MIDTTFMRTMMHWEVKSQQVFTVFWTTPMRFNIDCTKSTWGWGDSVLIINCTTDDKNDILPDNIITYTKYDL